MNYFRYVRDKYLSRAIAACDASINPLRMTYEEHKRYCRAETPEDCPFYKRRIKWDDMDVLPLCSPTLKVTRVQYDLSKAKHKAEELRKQGKTEELRKVLEKVSELEKIKKDPEHANLFSRKELSKRDARLAKLVPNELDKPSVHLPDVNFIDLGHGLIPKFKFSSQFYIPECLSIDACKMMMKHFCKRYRGRAFMNRDGMVIDVRREKNRGFDGEYGNSGDTNWILRHKAECGIAKMRIMPMISALVQCAQFVKTEPADHDKNSDLKANGVSTYAVSFALENRDGSISDFSADIQVCNHRDGRRCLYDIINIRPYGTEVEDKYERRARREANRGVTADMLADFLNG